ncbi:hypothetical protein OCK02_17335 [Rhizobium sp. TRM96647]|uniref:hypothetical protein n=1 Tax=unclassified Rhizobium TaxID=2613769 RepID=UPI0021E9542E|nr:MULTISPECIES: hypothetical protein [unclassified Rhizobium]MCV3737968.1 hypothetical protein [Rhizobium sp. TRM96647]MCV3759655.1 hypothetical protein [Rhizobium sp. TRM96650]
MSNLSGKSSSAKSLLGKAVAVALLAVAGLSAAAPAASAGGLDIRIETVGYRDGYYGRGPDRHDRRHDRWDDRRGRCAPWVAVDKARSHGLRGARVAAVNHRRVVVEGWRHHRYTQVAFANVARCPTLWR